MHCRFCGTRLPPGGVICHKCLHEPPERRRGRWGGLALILVVLLWVWALSLTACSTASDSELVYRGVQDPYRHCVTQEWKRLRRELREYQSGGPVRREIVYPNVNEDETILYRTAQRKCIELRGVGR